MQGPPPSEAGPSGSNSTFTGHPQAAHTPTPPNHAPIGQSQLSGTFSQFSVYDRTVPTHAGASPSVPSGKVLYPPAPPHTPQTSQFSYYNYAPAPQGPVQGWPPSYSSNTHPPYAYYGSNTSPAHQYTAPLAPSASNEKANARSPSLPPPPPFRKHWDEAIKAFLRNAGLTQALRGFEGDMLILNEDFERTRIPVALERLQKDLTNMTSAEPEGIKTEEQKSLDDRKLEHAHFRPDIKPRTPSTITRTISRFLAQNRARNDASNRKEFLLSLAEKRQKMAEAGMLSEGTEPAPSCARTDAKTQDREIQMKYDIAKNEDGPLRKTIKREKDDDVSAAKASALKEGGDIPTSERYPALDERIRNLETHVAVRYVPSPPRSLLDRLKYLEDHLIYLEKEYPSWAALHFNQPRRGWPPPPRPTPIIVPSHLTSSTVGEASNTLSAEGSVPAAPSEPNSSKSKTKGAKNSMSSLHRAVMERLEVQKAMKDLEGVKTEPEQ